MFITLSFLACSFSDTAFYAFSRTITHITTAVCLFKHLQRLDRRKSFMSSTDRQCDKITQAYFHNDVSLLPATTSWNSFAVLHPDQMAMKEGGTRKRLPGIYESSIPHVKSLKSKSNTVVGSRLVVGLPNLNCDGLDHEHASWQS